MELAQILIWMNGMIVRGVAAKEQRTLLAENGAEVPHQVWHYLSDADIRAKDADYAKTQIQALREVLGL